jgi:hypothetical protein
VRVVRVVRLICVMCMITNSAAIGCAAKADSVPQPHEAAYGNHLVGNFCVLRFSESPNSRLGGN